MFNFKELIAYLAANNIPMTTQEEVRRGLMALQWSNDDVQTAIVILEAGGGFARPGATVVTDDPTEDQPLGARPPQRSYSSKPKVGMDAMSAAGYAARQQALSGVDSTRLSGTSAMAVEATRVKNSISNRLNTNTKLDAASINKLLGVDVDFTEETKEVRRVLRTPRMTGADQFVALLMASLLSAGILFAAMYYYQFGLFHHTSSFASYLDTQLKW